MENTTQKNGHIVLVGAGPGDPDLLTMRAFRMIQHADVVVYDRLVSDEIIALIPDDVEKVFVGKFPGRHTLKQDEINSLLVDLAQRHDLVVRLKGGDPFVFGRGSEEAEFMLKHNIDFDVVPGITAAAGCGAAARIPLTHRGVARSVRFVTGHHKEDQTLDVDWASLSDPEMTVVIYMGLGTVETIAQEMIKAGRSAQTPAAIVEKGATAQQRIAFTTLADLPATCRQGAFEPPSLFIIGHVVDIAKILNDNDQTV